MKTRSESEEILALDRSEYFKGCSLANKKLFLTLCSSRMYAKDTLLFSEGMSGDGLYLVVSGRVRLFTSYGLGDEFTISIQSNGCLFGEVSVISGFKRSASAIVVEKCRLLFLESALYREWIDKNPSFMEEVVTGLARRLVSTTKEARSLALENVRQRVIRFLLKCAEEQLSSNFNDSTEFPVHLENGFSHQELASMIGSSREMVSKTLSSLAKEGFISLREGKKLSILKSFDY